MPCTLSLTSPKELYGQGPEPSGSRSDYKRQGVPHEPRTGENEVNMMRHKPYASTRGRTRGHRSYRTCRDGTSQVISVTRKGGQQSSVVSKHTAIPESWNMAILQSQSLRKRTQKAVFIPCPHSSFWSLLYVFFLLGALPRTLKFSPAPTNDKAPEMEPHLPQWPIIWNFGTVQKCCGSRFRAGLRVTSSAFMRPVAATSENANHKF